ncbi:hypothetical protein AVEN_11312-1 [Araneus ventricosus]|uniref:Uncharacterized protein n=1 Tax=Araneus ventricosus TaxID=182803 RepID=A0A4Y2DYD4_ARAVE|nr:hypothetical protein AVEN_11312-1 [Araneus ventricosus]
MKFHSGIKAHWPKFDIPMLYNRGTINPSKVPLCGSVPFICHENSAVQNVSLTVVAIETGYRRRNPFRVAKLLPNISDESKLGFIEMSSLSEKALCVSWFEPGDLDVAMDEMLKIASHDTPSHKGSVVLRYPDENFSDRLIRRHGSTSWVSRPPDAL